jgi:cytochrome P450
MEPNANLNVDSINLSDMEFWRQPWAERETAFATLRRESPITHFDEPVIEGTSIEFPVGNGYYAVTKYRDVQTASRHPETFLSGPGRSRRWTCPVRWSSTSRA